MGPMKYVKIKGKKIKDFGIIYFWLSLTIHEPQNRFRETKCIQKIIRNVVSVNKLLNSFSPKYNKKTSEKSYPEIKNL